MINNVIAYLKKFAALIFFGKIKYDSILLVSEELHEDDVKSVIADNFSRKYEVVSKAPRWVNNEYQIKIQGVELKLNFKLSEKSYCSHEILISGINNQPGLGWLLLFAVCFVIPNYSPFNFILVFSALLVSWIISFVWLAIKTNKLKSRLSIILNYVYETTYLKEYYAFLFKDGADMGHHGIHEHPNSNKYRF